VDAIAAAQRDEYQGLEDAIPDLKRLDRYERRAWPQQKCAIRGFVNIKLQRMLDARAADYRSNSEPAGTRSRQGLSANACRYVTIAWACFLVFATVKLVWTF
jgi:hypothetical protein